jgi:hypothetical protein
MFWVSSLENIFVFLEIWTHTHTPKDVGLEDREEVFSALHIIKHKFLLKETKKITSERLVE